MDQILSYREMCEAENVQTLQRGMNYRLNPAYSVILMSRRNNAPYNDAILNDGLTILYEGHDEPKTDPTIDPKTLDQPLYTKNGNLTQNGRFVQSIKIYKLGKDKPERVKVYEKMLSGVWSLKGYFDLIDFEEKSKNNRKVIVFKLKLSEHQDLDFQPDLDLAHTRLIPSEVKLAVWKRDKGQCVLCGSNKNLHFDHDLPFSKGGSSLTEKNIRLLCAKCNWAKSDKIE